MTLPSSGPISMQQVLVELQIANPSRTTPISLNDADVRALAAKPSGPISMSDLYGKSSLLSYVYVNEYYGRIFHAYPDPGWWESTGPFTTSNFDIVMPVSSTGTLTNATLHVQGEVTIIDTTLSHITVHENAITNPAIFTRNTLGVFELTKFYSSINVDTTPIILKASAYPNPEGSNTQSVSGYARAWFTV